VYEVFLEHRAEKDLGKFQDDLHHRIIAEIKSLKENPRPQGSRKIVGVENAWRIRIGDYRVLYEIDEKKKSIFIMRVRHRREAYR